jgi:hypothetical protein
MGSISDMPVMQEAIDILKGFDIETEVDIVSAHRTLKNYLILVKRTQAWYLSNNCGCWWRGAFTRNGCFYVATCYWSSCKI